MTPFPIMLVLGLGWHSPPLASAEVREGPNEFTKESTEEITVELHAGETMAFVWIEPGSFAMGSSPAAAGRSSDEMPQREVVISKGFYLGKYEITQSQWMAVMGTAPWTGKKHVQRHRDHPAVYISWTAVQELLFRLNEGAGEQLYRLPSEAEWEYACRAGTDTRWFFGDDGNLLEQYAWFIDNGPRAGLSYAQPVGGKLPSPWGLYDVYGNAWEWVQDWYHPAYAGGPHADPAGLATGTARVMRGGGFVNEARNVRSAKRFSHEPSLRFSAIGARLVRTKDRHSGGGSSRPPAILPSGGL